MAIPDAVTYNMRREGVNTQVWTHRGSKKNRPSESDNWRDGQKEWLPGIWGKDAG